MGDDSPRYVARRIRRWLEAARWYRVLLEELEAEPTLPPAPREKLFTEGVYR